MKNKLTLVFLLCACLTLAAITAPAQKNKSADVLITSADLDHSLVVGSTVFYQLRDEEIQGEPQIINGLIRRKVPACIVAEYFGARRDEVGRLVYALVIARPGFLGGPFTRDEVAIDSARDVGTFDTIQPGDLVH